MKKLFLLLVILVAVIVQASNTTVTATITGTDGQTWNNGTYTISFWPTPGVPLSQFNVSGSTFSQGPFTGTLDAAGAFSIVLTDNLSIAPSGSKWQFTICPNASQGCFTTQVIVTGGAQNLSTTLSALTPVIGVAAAFYPRAYSDSQMYTPSGNGSTYFDTLLNTPKWFNNGSWYGGTTIVGKGTAGQQLTTNSGATTNIWQSKRSFDPRDYVSIVAAITAATGHNRIEFGSAAYPITTALSATASPNMAFNFEGVSTLGSVFTWTGPLAGTALTLTNLSHARFGNFELLNGNAVGNGTGILLNSAAAGCSGGALNVHDLAIANFSVGLALGDASNKALCDTRYTNLNVAGNTTGVQIRGLSSTNNYFYNLLPSSNTTALDISGDATYNTMATSVYGGSASDNGTDFKFTTDGIYRVRDFYSEQSGSTNGPYIRYGSASNADDTKLGTIGILQGNALVWPGSAASKLIWLNRSGRYTFDGNLFQGGNIVLEGTSGAKSSLFTNSNIIPGITWTKGTWLTFSFGDGANPVSTTSALPFELALYTDTAGAKRSIMSFDYTKSDANLVTEPLVIDRLSVGTSLSSAGVITSTVATGTAPFTVASTTPVTNLTASSTAYNHSGAQLTNYHIVQDTCTLGTDCAVTLVGAAVFTSNTSYTCNCNDTTGANACKITITSGSQFTITGNGTDVISYRCGGN